MKDFKIFLIILICLFFIGCNTKESQKDKDIVLTSNDIVISNVSHDRFSYLIKNDEVNIIDIKLVNEDQVIDVNKEYETITNLNYNTNYILKVKYSYLKGSELVQKKIETSITTANIPSFNLDIEDNYVIFKFNNIDNLINLQIDEQEFNIDKSLIIVKDLEFSTIYNYIINYQYLDSTLSYSASFTTLSQKEITLSFVNPKKSNKPVGTVNYKTGEKIDIPIGISPLFSLNGKTYVLGGFDKDLNMIRTNEIVNAEYKELEEKNNYLFNELYPLIANASIEEVSKIEIWKSYVDAYDGTPIKYSIDNNEIDNILSKTKLINYTNNENYQAKYGQVRYMVFFYVNDCRYYFSFFDDAIEIFGNYYVINKSYIDFITNYCAD